MTQVSSSCLLEGTQITILGGGTKAIEALVPGDIILDHTLTERTVEGISYEFLQNQRLYGFVPNASFFTETHLLARPGGNGTVAHYVKNKKLIMQQNPLMEFLDIDEIQESQPFSIFTFENGIVKEKSVEIYMDPQPRAVDEKVYFLQVEGPHGTYFANGYACRHETPPMEGNWPNTMALLFSVFSHKQFKAIEKIPYTYDKLMAFNQTVEKIRSFVYHTLENLTVSNENCGNCKANTSSEKGEIMKQIFNSPSFSAVAVGVYGAVAKAISIRLDSGKGNCGEIREALPLIELAILEGYKDSAVYKLLYS